MATDTLIHVQLLSTQAAIDVVQAGGKGAALARLLQADLPVPPGCVLHPRTLLTFLEAQGLSLAANVDAIRQALQVGAPPQALREELHRALAQVGSPSSGWAVRSSAVAEDSDTASFAGAYESFLEVHERDLWGAIQACWASWWSARALAYRQQVGDTAATPAMAVVLQHMVPAQSAGVAFTAEPLRGDRTRMVINAAPGLGVAVVSGVVQPEQYTLAKSPQLSLLETRLTRPDQPPLLATEVVLTLGALCQRLEEVFGTPQDVEWAWDGEQCWILQSRPITTLTEDITSDTADVWGNANLKDVMPGLVSPFTWSLMQPQLEAAMREQYAEAGYATPGERPLMRRFWGRPYFNISFFQEASYTLYGTTAEHQAAQLGGAVVRRATPPPPPSLWQRLSWIRNFLRFTRVVQRARKAAPARFAAVQQYWHSELQEIPRLDRAALLQRIEQSDTIAQPFLVLHLYLTWGMSGNFGVLRELVKRTRPQAAPGLVAELVTGLGDISSAEHSYRLWALSRLARQSPQVMTFLAEKAWATWQQALAGTAFADAWQAFLDTYGHRSLYEVEIANPRWREKPDYLFDVLASYATMEQETAPFDPPAQVQRRQAAEREVMQGQSLWHRFWLHTVLRRAQAFSRLRENSKSHLVQLIDVCRLLALRAAYFLGQDGVLGDPEAVFLLTSEEIIAALKGTLAPEVVRRLVTQRRLERQRNAARHPPEVFHGSNPVYEEALPAYGTELSGLPSSPGRVTGIARVLRSPHEAARLQPGEILVAPSTDPGWTPLFLLASGLVMETGGYLSHGAIVAREYGIPAVLNIPLATQRIPDGSAIIVDGGQGIVQVLPADAPLSVNLALL